MALPLEDLLKPGDRIYLNCRAREWTRGKVFTVDEVKRWGVDCWTKEPSDAHRTIERGEYRYPATWDEIEGPA